MLQQVFLNLPVPIDWKRANQMMARNNLNFGLTLILKPPKNNKKLQSKEA